MEMGVTLLVISNQDGHACFQTLDIVIKHIDLLLYIRTLQRILHMLAFGLILQ